MTPPDPMPPAAKKGGFLKNLSPKQKRIAMVGGIAALLALIYLISKSRQPGQPEEEGGVKSTRQEAAEAFGNPVGGGGADAGAAFGAQSEVVGQRLEEVGSALGGVEAGLGEVGQSQAEIERSQEGLEGDIMQSRDQASEDSARLAAGLSKNSRQLAQVRKELHGKAPHHGGKGKKGRGKGKAKGRGKGKSKQPPKRKGRQRKPPRKRRR